jgi:heme/copper-type cytochrome/quinol oxidase subunit 2
VFLAWPVTKVVIAQKDTSAADITVKVTGYQWKWGYDYLKGEGEGISFYSTLDVSHREMSNSGKPPSTDDYLLKVDNPPVNALGSAAWREFGEWITAEGHEPAANLWEFYVAGPESSPDPSTWRTELNRPLKN